MMNVASLRLRPVGLSSLKKMFAYPAKHNVFLNRNWYVMTSVIVRKAIKLICCPRILFSHWGSSFLERHLPAPR